MRRLGLIPIWSRVQAEPNSHPQARTVVDGLPVHLLHVRSPHPDALPLVLTHGWPGSVVEFLDLIGPLTEPEDPRDVFAVVLPSLPGFRWSRTPTSPGWGRRGPPTPGRR